MKKIGKFFILILIFGCLVFSQVGCITTMCYLNKNTTSEECEEVADFEFYLLELIGFGEDEDDDCDSYTEYCDE